MLTGIIIIILAVLLFVSAAKFIAPDVRGQIERRLDADIIEAFENLTNSIDNREKFRYPLYSQQVDELKSEIAPEQLRALAVALQNKLTNYYKNNRRRVEKGAYPKRYEPLQLVLHEQTEQQVSFDETIWQHNLNLINVDQTPSMVFESTLRRVDVTDEARLERITKQYTEDKNNRTRFITALSLMALSLIGIFASLILLSV